MSTRYKIQQNPGTIFCTPRVVFSGTAAAGPPIVGGNGLGSLSYSASAQPLEVVFSGGIGPQDGKRYLIGQRVGATLSTGGLTADSDSYRWSVSGGEPFNNFTADDVETHFEPFAPGNTSSIGFYFRKPIAVGAPPAVVTCSAHLATPPGALPAEGLDVTASRKCGVEGPYDSLSITSVTAEAYHPSVEPGEGMQGIMKWRGRVATPTDFGRGGVWNVTQIIMPGRAYTDGNTGTTHRLRPVGGKAVDKYFATWPRSSGTGSYSADDDVVQDDSDNSQAGFGSSFVSVKVNESYVIYSLYEPPGVGSFYVPLWKLGWCWQGDANRSGDKWEVPNSEGKELPGEAERYPAFPDYHANVSPFKYDPPHSDLDEPSG